MVPQSPTDELINKRIGQRVVLKRLDDDTFGYPHYLVQCDCGTTSRVSEIALNGGKYLQCKACANKAKGENSGQWKGGRSYLYKIKGTSPWASQLLKGTAKNAAKHDYAPPIGSVQKVLELWAECKGQCLICGSQRRLALDHDHANYLTGNLRGFLCFKCNCAVGLINDSSAVAMGMANYLDKANEFCAVEYTGRTA